MRTFRIKQVQVKDRQDEDELSDPNDTRRSRESPPTPPGGSDERSESSANREAVFMPAGKTCNPAHRPGKIPCVQFAALAPNESGLVSSETHIDRKKPRNESQRHNLIKSKEMASIFSRIIAGEIPSYKVAEDENYYAFLDINPLTKGHTLVVPKQEVDYIFDLDDRTLAGMMVFAKQVAARIKREIACARVAVVVLGMEVPHAHIHLIPIQSENDVDFHREKLRLTPEEFREIAEKLAR